MFQISGNMVCAYIYIYIYTYGDIGIVNPPWSCLRQMIGDDIGWYRRFFWIVCRPPFFSSRLAVSCVYFCMDRIVGLSKLVLSIPLSVWGILIGEFFIGLFFVWAPAFCRCEFMRFGLDTIFCRGQNFSSRSAPESSAESKVVRCG